VFVVILTRVIGRREAASLAPIDLILLIILGDARRCSSATAS
jgi:uncharacterized membrane protein YcaP (DUF421 family)